MRKEKGFSLVEAMAAMVVGSIVLTTTLPELASLLERNRQVQATNQLTGALHYARNAAALNRATVTLCPGTEHCLDTHHWQDHILIFIDRNQNGQLDNDDELLQQFKLARGYSWQWSNFRKRTYFQFAGNGRTRALNGTFSLCHDKVSARQIVINITGRVRTQTPQSPASCS